MTTETLSKTIEHSGIIKEITPKTIKVSLLNVSGCSTCHTKSTCGVSDVDNKIIDIVNDGQKIEKGETVKVIFEKSLGPLALFLGYLFPFILMMIILIISWSLTNDEVFAGLASLISVGVYYLGLTLFRSQLKSTFTFKILKG
jgi:sigma-E factor negative regulatory protein RseC